LTCPGGTGGGGSAGRVYSRQEFTALTPLPLFLRGDVDWNEGLTLGDGIMLLEVLHMGRRLDCGDAADVTDNGKVDLSDAISLFSYLFLRSGVLPPRPAGQIGPDPTLDGLGCGN